MLIPTQKTAMQKKKTEVEKIPKTVCTSNTSALNPNSNKKYDGPKRDKNNNNSSNNNSNNSDTNNNNNNATNGNKSCNFCGLTNHLYGNVVDLKANGWMTDMDLLLTLVTIN